LAVEDAAMAGARAAIKYLQEHAGYSRIGHHSGGSGRWVDAHEFVVAQFLQHDSYDRDPQLHVHQTILNRVLCADGTWRALTPGPSTRCAAKPALRPSGYGCAPEPLPRRGVRDRPDDKAREVVGVPQNVIGLFSSRRHAVSARTAELIAEFRATNGREPSPAERYYLAQQATLATQTAKSHDGETRTEQLARWTEQCHAYD